MPSNSRLQLESWIKNLDVKARTILDVGGSQLPLYDRIKNKTLAEYVILDLEQPHETKLLPEIIMDLNKVYALEQWARFKNYFKVAFCLEVMEYIYNPVQALKNISYFMDKGAELYISFHFLYPIHRPSGLDYLRYTEHGAKKLLEEAGFKIEELVYKEMSLGVQSYEQMTSFERMRKDGDYHHHDAQGYLIKAIKI